MDPSSHFFDDAAHFDYDNDNDYQWDEDGHEKVKTESPACPPPGQAAGPTPFPMLHHAGAHSQGSSGNFTNGTTGPWMPYPPSESMGYYPAELFPRPSKEDNPSVDLARQRTSSTSTDTDMMATSRDKSSSSASAQPSASSRSTIPPDEPEPHQKRKGKRAVQERTRSPENDESKRNKFLEKNRVAASKCRKKKKEWLSELQETKEELEAQHSQLQSEYKGLMNEANHVKSQLMSHASCNDPKIDQWLENEARRIVGKAASHQARQQPRNGTRGVGQHFGRSWSGMQQPNEADDPSHPASAHGIDDMSFGGRS